MLSLKRPKIDIRDYSTMDLKEIAEIIKSEILSKQDPQPLVEAVNALSELNKIEDNYYFDSGLQVVFQVLEHSKRWDTFTGKLIRAELEKRMNSYNKKLKRGL